MGLVHAEVELINVDDFADAKRHIIDEDEVRKITVSVNKLAHD